MKPQPPASSGDRLVLRQTFRPSANMSGAVRSFLTSDAELIPLYYQTERSALLTPDEFKAAHASGALKRVLEMARNTEITLYPNGTVYRSLGSTSVRLAFELKPFPQKELIKMGDRLEGLDDPSLGPSYGRDVIYTEAEKKFALSEEDFEHAVESFKETITDEFKLHFYKFTPESLSKQSL